MSLSGDGGRREGQDVPLVVDLDGTLLRTDTFLELALLVAKRHPLSVLRMPFWLLRGRPYLKDRLVERATLDVSLLPLRPSLLEFLETEHRRGRRIFLATATHRSIADAIHTRFPFLHEVFATEGHGSKNLAGKAKAEILRETFGERGFDYAGNELRDLHIWKIARSALVVGASSRLLKRARAVADVAQVFDVRRGVLRAFLQAIRPHQWLKNLLIFVPLLTAHVLGERDILLAGLLAFTAFSVTTSGVYLLNDLLDLESDRRHPHKRYRPLAAGDLPIVLALVAVPLFFVLGIGIASLLRSTFLLILALYIVLAFAYSFRLKQVPLLDVFVLAALYTIRIVAGHEATGVAYSFWLLLFAMFFFVSLALVKRHSELVLLHRHDRTQASGRGYVTEDRDQLAMLGGASGYLSVLVLALYIHSDAVIALYRMPALLWLLCPLMLFWVSRLWLCAHRGEVHEDPILFTVKDPVSYLVGVLVLAVMALAA